MVEVKYTLKKEFGNSYQMLNEIISIKCSINITKNDFIEKYYLFL